MRTKVVKYKNLLEVQESFPDVESCIVHVNNILFNGVRVCKGCSHTEFNYIRTRHIYQCKKCRKQLSPLAGTIFHKSFIPLPKWFMAIHLITSFKKGVSSLQIAAEIDVSQKTAWHMIHKIRSLLKNLKAVSSDVSDNDPDSGKLNGEVEIDEVFIGGRSHNKHTIKKLKGTQGVSVKVKVGVLGFLQRGTGKTICAALQEHESFLEIVLKNVALGSIIYTDENTKYEVLDQYYTRKIINHAAKQYVDGEVHTNSIESVWAMLRRGLAGTYHHMSYKHLDKYLAEFSYRITNKKLIQEERFNNVLRNANEIITYDEITKFDPDRNNYSGRGPTYPLDLQGQTRKRGRHTRDNEELFRVENISSRYAKRQYKLTYNDRYKDIVPVKTVLEDVIVTSVDSELKAKGRGRPKGSKNKSLVENPLENDNSELSLEKVKEILSQVDVTTLQKLVTKEIKKRATQL